MIVGITKDFSLVVSNEISTRLRSIGGDIKASAAGIYLHIIWYPNDPQTFWLYVGQARHLGNRISDHNDRVYRRKHPSLHYHVWDSQEEMCSEFVILAIFQNAANERNLSRYEQCLLNLLEMWMACLFRTLTAKDLDTYLPPSVDRSTAGRHLNVVPPIWQRFHDEDSPARKDIFDRAGFEELLRSADPAVRLWARHATASYNDLRNSPDPRLRCYWFANNRRQLRQAWIANEKQAIDDMKVYQIEGKEVTVCCSRGRDRGYILCGKFNFPLPQSLGISPGSKVFVQFHLYEIAVSHRYVSQAMPFDPASRLAISIKACNNSGTEVDRWIQSPGKKVPMKINALVDMLEGVTLTETRALSRRWSLIRPEEGSPQKTYYTSM
ncbi:unnamed protein product [Penicillium salamii]|nr:unnamed protein product [Penicillium salamii]